MLIRLIFFLFISTSLLSAKEISFYTSIPDILPSDHLEFLQKLTVEQEPTYLWYGRYNYWKEGFVAQVSDNDKIITFHHTKEYDSTVIDKLAQIFLVSLQDMGLDISHKKIILECYLDRNIVDRENASTSGMFWHRDSILVDGNTEIADYSMILLINGEELCWEGADLILQEGGKYAEKGSYTWINSDKPKIVLKSFYNQAIIFRNFDTGHMVTPLIPVTSQTSVCRDVFIVTCYIKDVS